MPSSGIRVIVHCHVKDPEAFLKAAKELVQESRKEEGCLMCEVFRDMDNSANKELFTFINHWESLEAFQEHQGKEHFKKFMALDLMKEKHTVNKYISVGI